jgi:hypothetical protein
MSEPETLAERLEAKLSEKDDVNEAFFALGFIQSHCERNNPEVREALDTLQDKMHDL